MWRLNFKVPVLPQLALLTRSLLSIPYWGIWPLLAWLASIASQAGLIPVYRNREWPRPPSHTRPREQQPASRRR